MPVLMMERKLSPRYVATPTVEYSGFSFVLKEIMLMKQRVAEMEKEAKKLRELQAAAEEANSAVGGQDTAMETEEDKTLADSRSIYVGNVCHQL